MSSRQSWVFTPLIFGLLFVTLSFAEGTDPNEDFRVAWLKQHAIPLRSIEPNDEDFSDLEPLLKVLRDVRIVQLGEQSHGDGATFYCKTRLIKFLHQKLGFDVLAFESGLYDCRKAWELLRGGMEPYEAFSHGVYYIWARSEQCRPLIDYWGRAAKSNEPLELCGFDCKFSARTSRDLVVKDVGAVLDKLGPAASNAEQHAAIMKILHKLTNWQRPTMLESQQGDNALAAWRKSLETARPSNSLTESELAFWRQFVASTSILIERESLANQENEEESWMLRDKQMARNLLWLARTVYPQRKVIVWAGSPHLMHNPPPKWRVKWGLKTTMGHEVWKVLGKETYTVAFTSAEGEANAWHWEKAWQLEPPPPGSLEDLFVRAGCTNAFVDFRGLGPDGAWLKQKLITRLVMYPWGEDNCTDMFDGIVFIKKMFGSTQRRNN